MYYNVTIFPSLDIYFGCFQMVLWKKMDRWMINEIHLNSLYVSVFLVSACKAISKTCYNYNISMIHFLMENGSEPQERLSLILEPAVSLWRSHLWAPTFSWTSRKSALEGIPETTEFFPFIWHMGKLCPGVFDGVGVESTLVHFFTPYHQSW